MAEVKSQDQRETGPIQTTVFFWRKPIGFMRKRKSSPRFKDSSVSVMDDILLRHREPCYGSTIAEGTILPLPVPSPHYAIAAK
jgi:hypothetical protein